MTQLTEYFFKSLPPYFRNEDTYKASPTAKGFLERFLDAFQSETELYVDDIDNMWEIIFPMEADEKFQNLIGDFYGNPPDTFADVDVYRALLRNIIYLLKWKGTIKGLQMFFQLFGADADITVNFPDEVRYNQDEHEDPGELVTDTTVYDYSTAIFDATCYPCVTVDVNVLDPTYLITLLDEPTYVDNTKRAIHAVLNFLFPINASLNQFQYNGSDRDTDLPTEDPVR